ncbi:MAG: hypothetical protein M1817_006909 [Caeruleum heppii]|nr:MAG: hypothetical protein M1817_006909 [Caeruleum heppii]
MSSAGQKEHGWTAVPRDPSVLLKGQQTNHEPVPVLVKDITVPDTPLASRIQEYAQRELQEETFNHSMRVYYYGQVIASQQFPDWQYSTETYFLTCLLHDIGTTTKNLNATLMSFEFYGGFLAYQLLLKECGAPQAQGEAVVEAIIRHQDLGKEGKISTLGQLIQLATVFDNMTPNPSLVHRTTIVDVCNHFPRKKWSSCFAATIREEVRLKPWSHTTKLGERDFPEGVEGNEVMKEFD